MYRIKDSRTGLYATTAAFLTKERAHEKIMSFYQRHDDFGRPDISIKDLQHLIIVYEGNKPEDAT